MKYNQSKCLVIAVMAMSVGLTACDQKMLGDGFTQGAVQSKANGGLDNGVGEIIDKGDVDMTSLDQDLDTLEADMKALTAKANGLSVGGLASKNAIGTMSVDKDIKQMFTKLLSTVQNVKDKVSALKTQIESRLGGIDPKNPVYAQTIAKLNQALAYLDQLQSYVTAAVNGVINVIDGAIGRLDQAIAKMDPKQPLTWLAQAAWVALKVVIYDYRDKLVAAIKI